MRRLLALLLAGCLFLGLTGCNADPPEPAESAEPSPTPTPTQAVQSARFSLGYDPTAPLHPITGSSQVNHDLTGLVYQCLYELDNDFAPQPVLARSSSVSEDGLTWTFTLDPGAVFSDGTPLTAQHAADALNAARTSALYGGRLAQVTGAWAGEDGALSVSLSAPNGALPALLDIPVVLEQEEGPPLGSGYYCYETAGDNLFLRANPLHAHAAALPYDVIPLTPVTNAAERIAAFDSGSITAVTTDFSGAYALSYSSSYETCDYPTTTLIYVGFRTASGPCRSPLVRRAFAQCFDRDGLVRVLLSGHGDPALLPVHPRLSGGAGETLAFDPESAAALLEQAGYTRNEEDGLLYLGNTPLSVTLLVNSDNETRQRMAEQLALNLQELGVTVTVDRPAWKDFNAALASGSFDLYIGEVQLTGDLDPSVLLTGTLNYGGFDSAETVQALWTWQAASGPARDQAARQLWTLLEQEVPVAALCFKRGSLLVRWGMASDLTPTRANPFYRMEGWTTTGP